MCEGGEKKGGGLQISPGMRAVVVKKTPIHTPFQCDASIQTLHQNFMPISRELLRPEGVLRRFNLVWSADNLARSDFYVVHPIAPRDAPDALAWTWSGLMESQ